MSRYMVNKLMWEVDQSDDALAAFKDDPAGFVSRWEQAAESPVPPLPGGGRLTSDERTAIVTLDFGALYAMGTNPFLLWQFVRSVSVPDLGTVEEAIRSFREAAAPHGYPDFST